MNIAPFLLVDAATPSNAVTVFNNVTTSDPPLDCTHAFVYLTVDLTAPSHAATTANPFTLTAMLQNVVSPPMSGSIAYPQQNMPTGTIQLLEGANIVATGTIANQPSHQSYCAINCPWHSHLHSAVPGRHELRRFGLWQLHGHSDSHDERAVGDDRIVEQAGDGYQATVVVSNRGTSTARNVVVTTATLGASSGAPTPQSLGNIAPGAYAMATVNFPASVGASGAAVIERYSGTYNGGSFIGSLRAVLP